MCSGPVLHFNTYPDGSVIHAVLSVGFTDSPSGTDEYGQHSFTVAIKLLSNGLWN
jgi:hypothetical protein